MNTRREIVTNTGLSLVVYCLTDDGKADSACVIESSTFGHETTHTLTMRDPADVLNLHRAIGEALDNMIPGILSPVLGEASHEARLVIRHADIRRLAGTGQ